MLNTVCVDMFQKIADCEVGGCLMCGKIWYICKRNEAINYWARSCLILLCCLECLLTEMYFIQGLSLEHLLFSLTKQVNNMSDLYL
jgi:hypothetical protein